MQGNIANTFDTWRCGYVFSCAEADKLKKQFESNTCSRFVVLKSDGNFGKMRTYTGIQVIQWDYNEKHATPFIHIGNKIFECHRGKDWKAKLKRVKREARRKEVSGNPQAKKIRKHKGTKKTGCCARIVMREVMMFPSFQARHDISHRRKIASQLRAVLSENPDVGERRVYVSFPRREDHKGHHLDDSDRDDVTLDPRLLSRIHELQASSQVQTITDMKFLLKEFVTDVLCKNQLLPSRKDRRFFPTVSDIRKVLKRSTNLAQSKSALVVHYRDNSCDSRESSGLDVRVIDDVLGKFEVVDQNTSGDISTVEFNPEGGLPVCSCSTWERGRPPCEHFRAVFNLTSWGMERLPEDWRTFANVELENEYFVATLTPIVDVPHLPGEEDSVERDVYQGEESTNEEEEDDEEERDKELNELHLAEMPDREVEEDAVEDLREGCADQLQRIQDLMHLVNDRERLLLLKKILSESVRDLEELVSNDSGLSF